MENLKKIENFWKKVLTKGIARGIINKRSRERVENDRQTMTAQKALCKLNNTKKDKKPWQLFEFEKYFSNSIWEAKFELI